MLRRHQGICSIPSATIAKKTAAVVLGYGIAFTAEWSATDLVERCESMVIHRGDVVDASNAVQIAIELPIEFLIADRNSAVPSLT